MRDQLGHSLSMCLLDVVEGLVDAASIDRIEIAFPVVDRAALVRHVEVEMRGFRMEAMRDVALMLWDDGRIDAPLARGGSLSPRRGAWSTLAPVVSLNTAANMHVPVDLACAA